MNIKKLIALFLSLVCLSTLVACTLIDTQAQNNAEPAYFIGEVIECHGSGCIVRLTDTGSWGGLPIGEIAHVSTNVENCPEYDVGDYIKVVFDGTVAESYPPQIMHVIRIEKTDSNGNRID